ncbi:hypothetical protein MYAM1_001087 [Malassezia yamatoensis]|uniref:Uncharacterized protein n=1 Tax=Malassezia yamatoensis TaxID=253288 RepID=A0AAJ5YSD9_9BASI|nr:hypothetical protein MYAM1_001087 [Malassezia yamatoensis]
MPPSLERSDGSDQEKPDKDTFRAPDSGISEGAGSEHLSRSQTPVHSKGNATEQFEMGSESQKSRNKTASPTSNTQENPKRTTEPQNVHRSNNAPDSDKSSSGFQKSPVASSSMPSNANLRGIPRRTKSPDDNSKYQKELPHRRKPVSQPKRSKSSLLLDRKNSYVSGPVAPILDNRRVTSTQHGIETEDSSIHNPSRFYLNDEEDARTPNSRPYMLSAGSSSNLKLGSSAQEQTVSPYFARSRNDSVTSLTSLLDGSSGLRRSSSTQSLNDSHLRRSFSSRGHLQQMLQRNQIERRGSALSSLTGEHSGPVRMGAAGHSNSLLTSAFANLLSSGKPPERSHAPIVSKFARYEQQFDPAASAQHFLSMSSGANDTPGRVVSVDVPATSVYSEQFVDRIRAQMDRIEKAENKQSSQKGKESRSKQAANSPADAHQYRYLLDYGLSGPSIDKELLSRVKLTPRSDAGLALEPDVKRESFYRPRNRTQTVSGSQSNECSTQDAAKLAVPDSATTLGPNMIPFHFIHALTSAMENALALDRAEVPAMASLLPGVADDDSSLLPHLTPDDASETEESTGEENVHFIDNRSMRAIAYTAQAIAVQRIHTVTRRFADPFRDALARVSESSGYLAYLQEQERILRTSASSRNSRNNTQQSQGSGIIGSRWRRGPLWGAQRSQGQESKSDQRPTIPRSNTALASLGSLAGRPNSPRLTPSRG